MTVISASYRSCRRGKSLISGSPFLVQQSKPAVQVIDELPRHPSRTGSAGECRAHGFGLKVPGGDLQLPPVAQMAHDGQVGFLSHGIKAECEAETVGEGEFLCYGLLGVDLRFASVFLEP